ncbi:hypothetical protein ACFLY4_09390 [Chloroflexota bacterium]
MNNTTSTQSNEQYSLAKILGIWSTVLWAVLAITLVLKLGPANLSLSAKKQIIKEKST